MTRHALRVEAAVAGQRLDAFVASADLGLTRSQVRLLIDAGHVTVGGVLRKAGYALRADDEVVVDVPPPPPSAAEPEDIPLDVIYEDDVLVAINKAPGMVVHPSPGRMRGTLVNALVHRWGTLPTHDHLRPGIVHRLDRETSGVIVVARTVAALEHLGRQFHDRTVRKRYLAVVVGVVRDDEMVIDAAIGRHPMERKRMSLRTKRGRAAITRVRVVERFAHATLVEALPRTGRTHQIRVHLAARGHPIVGDAVYGRRRATTLPITRHALHAASLVVTHPTRGDRLAIAAPLPVDMEALIATLRTVHNY